VIGGSAISIDFCCFSCDDCFMTITQTIDVPSSRLITLEVPREIPAGPVILSFTPAKATESITEKLNSYYNNNDSHLPSDIKAVNYRMLREEDW
jgi:hypothetical protein